MEQKSFPLIIMKIILVSAADTKFWPFLSGMLASIEEGAKTNNIEVGILDLGLVGIELSRLVRFGAMIVRPKWDYELTHFVEPAKEVFKAMTARPHLRHYFPGYDLYIWIDADAWLQNWDPIVALIDGAIKNHFAVVAENHQAYQKKRALASYYLRVRTLFGPAVANSLTKEAGVNSGVFAAATNAPHWLSWHQYLKTALERSNTPFYYVEQLALNAVMYHEKLPVHWLPPKYNWVCQKALPMLSPTTGKLVDPCPPHDELGIIHLVGGVKKHAEFRIHDLNGGAHTCTLRHAAL